MPAGYHFPVFWCFLGMQAETNGMKEANMIKLMSRMFLVNVFQVNK